MKTVEEKRAYMREYIRRRRALERGQFLDVPDELRPLFCDCALAIKAASSAFWRLPPSRAEQGLATLPGSNQNPVEWRTESWLNKSLR
jgi:hypothetical protein